MRSILYSDETLNGIGSNSYGKLGVCTPSYVKDTPSTLSNTWKTVSSKKNFTLAVDKDGNLWSWGYNQYGQLGNGTTATTCTLPAQVNAAPWQAVSAGDDHGAGVKDGRLYSWGQNEGGSGANPEWSPNFRGYTGDWLTVDASRDFTLALRSNGFLHSWGENSSGQLGLGDTTDRFISDHSEPLRVGTDDWAGIATGIWNSLALNTNGSIWAWGSSNYMLGQGGYGDNNLLVPTRVLDGPPRCGDGTITTDSDILEANEQCDDGALNGNAGYCTPSCRCANTRVVYVDASATGANNGTSWTDAYTDLQLSMDNMEACDVVWVAEGTYTGSGGPEIPVLTMKPGAEIYGGFTRQMTHFSQRSSKEHTTVLDGEDLRHHVVVGADDTTLDGFGITRGNANGTAPNDKGAGYYLDADGLGEVILRDLAFQNNSAAKNGGGIYAYHATNRRPLVIDRCGFFSNAAMSGGGLWFSGPELHLKNSTFGENKAESMTAIDGRGGAIFNEAAGALPRFSNLLIARNSASNEGAAMWIGRQSWAAHLTVVDNTGTAAEAIYFDHFASSIGNGVVWNPGLPKEINQGNLSHTCVSTIAGTGNVDLTASPFDTTTPDEYYLAGNSACRDAGDEWTAYEWIRDWFEWSTTADGLPDEDAPDMGFHWF